MCDRAATLWRRLGLLITAGGAPGTWVGAWLLSVSALPAYLLPPAPAGITTAPDWAPGALFGIGGLVGGNLGERCQGRVPQKLLKLFLAIILLGLAGRYFLY